MHAPPRHILAWMMALAVSPPPVAAQGGPAADLVGERVRIIPEGGGSAITGTVTQQIPLALFVRGDSGFTRPVPFDAVQRIERSLGRNSYEQRGLLIGAGTGAFASALLLIALADCDECGNGTPVRGVVTFVSVGAVIGLIGGRIASREDWVEVPLRRDDFGALIDWRPTEGRLGVGLSVSFD